MRRSKKRDNFGEEHSLGTFVVLYRAFPDTPGLHFKDAILQEKDPVWILCCWVVFPIIVISSEKKGFTYALASNGKHIPFTKNYYYYVIQIQNFQAIIWFLNIGSVAAVLKMSGVK